MSPERFQQIAIRDPRIAPHATGLQPAWLWSADGSTILWTNAAGAAAFGLRDRRQLAEPLGAFDPHRRQVTQLAIRLPKSGAARLERMRGFGATPGQLATCSCAQLALEDGTNAILIVSLVGAGKPLPISERLQFHSSRLDQPAVALSPQAIARYKQRCPARRGPLRAVLGPTLFARGKALRDGHADVAFDEPQLALYRVGAGHDVAIHVLMPATQVTPRLATSLDSAAPAAAEPDEPLDRSFADEVLVDEDNL